MSVEVVPGGQRRIDRVLDPGFTDGVDQLGLPELRARREEAEAEEADVSYLRRLLQGRLDILRAELERPSAGGDQDVAGLLAGLPAILSDQAPGTFSAVPRVQAPSRAGEHRRRVERLVSDETYLHFVYGAPHASAAAVEGWRDNVVVVGTFSKSFGMTGWRAGYLVAASGVCTEAMKIQDAMIICAPVISQIAAEAAVRVDVA